MLNKYSNRDFFTRVTQTKMRLDALKYIPDINSSHNKVPAIYSLHYKNSENTRASMKTKLFEWRSMLSRTINFWFYNIKASCIITIIHYSRQKKSYLNFILRFGFLYCSLTFHIWNFSFHYLNSIIYFLH